jgi:hypothetical protein
MAYRWKAKSTTPGDWVFLNAALTTAMGWPAQPDVKLNVHYGYSPEQFTGSLVVTGGGAGTYPHEADTWTGTGLYGPTGSEYTPSMRASDIANCEAGNIRRGITIDDVVGEFAIAGNPPDTSDTEDDAATSETIEQAIHERLATIYGVVVAVQSRMYYGQRARDSALPAIVIRRTGTQRDVALEGQTGYVVASFTLECLALTMLSAIGLAKQVRKGFDDAEGDWGDLDVQRVTVDGDTDVVFDGGDADSLTVFCRQLNLEIAYQEDQ